MDRLERPVVDLNQVVHELVAKAVIVEFGSSVRIDPAPVLFDLGAMTLA